MGSVSRCCSSVGSGDVALTWGRSTARQEGKRRGLTAVAGAGVVCIGKRRRSRRRRSRNRERRSRYESRCRNQDAGVRTWGGGSGRVVVVVVVAVVVKKRINY